MPDEEFSAQMDAFWQAAAGPAMQARSAKRSKMDRSNGPRLNLRLGAYVGQFADEPG